MLSRFDLVILAMRVSACGAWLAARHEGREFSPVFQIMPTLDQLPRDTPFDRFSACLAYQALESDWNMGGWLRERPSNQRRRESIGVQLARVKFRAGIGQGGCFSALLPDDTYDGFYDEHEGARESYINALIAFGLAPQVDPNDELGRYICAAYVPEFVAQYFPQLKG
jgi:hypothetical protein